MFLCMDLNEAPSASQVVRAAAREYGWVEAAWLAARDSGAAMDPTYSNNSRWDAGGLGVTRIDTILLSPAAAALLHSFEVVTSAAIRQHRQLVLRLLAAPI